MCLSWQEIIGGGEGGGQTSAVESDSAPPFSVITNPMTGPRSSDPQADVLSLPQAARGNLEGKADQNLVMECSSDAGQGKFSRVVGRTRPALREEVDPLE